MTNINRKLKIALAALVGIPLAAAGTLAVGSHLERRQTTHATIEAPIRQIRIDSTNGDVDVNASGGANIEVTSVSTWLLGKPTVRQYSRDGVLHLESNCYRLFCDTAFHVSAPEGIAIEIRHDVGDVRLQGRLGDVAVKTAIGDIRLDLGCASRILNLATHIGNVRVSTPAGSYAIAAHTRVGDRSLHGLVSDRGAAQTIHATTTVGNVTLLGV